MSGHTSHTCLGLDKLSLAVGLVFLSVDPSTFALVAALVLVRDVVSAVFGAEVGAYVDRVPRLRAASVMYCAQNVSVGGSALCLIATFVLKVSSCSCLASVVPVLLLTGCS